MTVILNAKLEPASEYQLQQWKEELCCHFGVAIGFHWDVLYKNDSIELTLLARSWAIDFMVEVLPTIDPQDEWLTHIDSFAEKKIGEL